MSANRRSAISDYGDLPPVRGNLLLIALAIASIALGLWL